MKHWKKIWNRVRRVRFKVDRKLEDHREDAGPVKTQGNGQVAPAVEQKTEDEMDRVRSENQLPAVQGRAKHRREKQPSLASVEDYRKLVAECNRAKEVWQNAWRKLDWVVEPEHIDYAIYSVIAAEKHYTALLKEAKGLREQLAMQ